MFRRTLLTHTRAFSSTRTHLKIIPEVTQTTPGKRPEDMDSLRSPKAADDGSRTAGMHNDPPGGLNENVPKSSDSGAGANSDSTPAMNKDGAIGSMFKSDGAIGGMADKVGGPFSKDGAIGSKFEADGSIGGAVHDNLGKEK